MERKKTHTLELDNYEHEILELVVHAENHEAILSEFSGNIFILGDCLRNLIKQNLIQIVEWDETSAHWKRQFFYDPDKLKEYRYQITALGFNVRMSKL